MFATGSPTLRQHSRTYYANDLIHLLARKQHVQLALDVCHIAMRYHVFWHRRLEFRLAPKHYYRKEILFPNAQEFLQRLHMLIVLMERVLKLVFFACQHLRPLRALFITEDPARHILRFDDKYAEARNNDVINLRSCAWAIRCRQRDVVDIDVDIRVKKHLVCERALQFS